MADAQGPRGGTWNNDGVILFATALTDGLFRVPAAGRQIAPVTKVDASTNENGHFWPQFLPDGHHFLYVVRSSKRDNSGIYLGSLDSWESKLLLQTNSGARYAPLGIYCS